MEVCRNWEQNYPQLKNFKSSRAADDPPLFHMVCTIHCEFHNTHLTPTIELFAFLDSSTGFVFLVDVMLTLCCKISRFFCNKNRWLMTWLAPVNVALSIFRPNRRKCRRSSVNLTLFSSVIGLIFRGKFPCPRNRVTLGGRKRYFDVDAGIMSIVIRVTGALPLYRFHFTLFTCEQLSRNIDSENNEGTRTRLDACPATLQKFSLPTLALIDLCRWSGRQISCAVV
jgi:hypothetical protein